MAEMAVGWGAIRQDVHSMVSQRQMRVGFELIATVNGHDRHNSLFFTWVRENYVTAIAAGIRVQSDLDSRSASLARVLHQMTRYPAAVTRKRYLSDRHATRPSSHYWQWANEGFDELAGAGGDHMDPPFLRPTSIASSTSRLPFANTSTAPSPTEAREVSKVVSHPPTSAPLSTLSAASSRSTAATSPTSG
jgi:hypothetical protein